LLASKKKNGPEKVKNAMNPNSFYVRFSCSLVAICLHILDETLIIKEGEKKMQDFEQLIRTLISQPKETPWLEFKENNADPELMGEEISSLANMAALEKRSHAYLVWGITDQGHALVGTTFSPSKTKKGNEDLLPWLSQNLSPRLPLRFEEGVLDGKSLVLLEIPPSEGFPLKWKGIGYCRVESYHKKLSDFPYIEKQLWLTLAKEKEENEIALEGLNEEQVSTLLNLPAYFSSLHRPLPRTREEMIRSFLEEGFLLRGDDGSLSISLLGGLTFAFDFAKIPALFHKEIVLTRYQGNAKNQIKDSQYFTSGYVLSFENIIRTVLSFSSLGEPVASNGLTVHLYRYPEIVLREAVTNMLIHQDLSVRGVSPMIAITDDAMEFINPGRLEIDPDHLIDTAPKSRNENLASFLRRIGIGDEKGTGYDKICMALEQEQMPAPQIFYDGIAVHVKIEAKKEFSLYSKKEKMDAVYFHACLCHQNGVKMTNESLRLRLGLNEKERYVVSRLLSEAVSNGRIKIEDPTSGVKNRNYLPYWA
jgi:ATP-dependent DNA helicase RecG